MLRGAELYLSGQGFKKMAARRFLSFVSFSNDEDPRQLSRCDEKMERLITLKQLFDVFLNSGAVPNTHSRSCRCSAPL